MSTFFPRVRIWPGKNTSIDAGTWGLGVDITPYVRRPGQDGGQVISYNSGRQDEANQVDAGTLNLTLDNRTGIFSPLNVNGPYYGLLKRNTPLQLTTDTGADSFTRTASGLGSAWTTGSGWSTNGSAAVATIGANLITSALLNGADAWNFDTRQTVWVDQVSTGATQIIVGMARQTDVSNAAMFRVEFNTAGNVDIRIGRRTTVGMVITSSLTTVFSYAANTKVRLRCVGDGQAMRMKVWKPANPALPDADEPDAWTLTATDSVNMGTGVGVYAWRVAGNTNTNPNMFVDDFTAAAEEWTGAVVQWPTRWSMTGANCWAPIQAAGVLRRLRQGQGLLQSPLERQLATYAPTGFWTFQDGPGSTSLASAIPGKQPATIDRVTAGGANDLAGASLAVTFDEPNSSITAKVGKPTGYQLGWAVMWLMKMGSLPLGTVTRVARIRATGFLSRWDILMSETGITLRGYAGGDDAAIVDVTNLYGANVNPLEWFAIQLEVASTGGSNVGYSLITHAVGDTAYYSMAGTYTGGPVMAATEVTLGGGALDGAAWSMLWMGPDELPFVDNTFSLVSSGYVGEKAMARAKRVAAEVKIPLVVEPGDSEAMGAQREANVLEALRACEGADYGVLYETGSGLGIRPRTARYNAPSKLALSMVAGHLAEPPEPIYDDQKLRNVWTVNRVGGSSATVVDDASVALEGEAAGSDTVNVATDDVLTNHAGWRTYLGVQDSLRWPSITLDFARNPGLLQHWRGRRYGFRFSVTTGLPAVAGSEADVIAEGYQAELHPDGWRVTLNCSGAAPWDVAVLEGATAVRLDTAGTILNGSVNAGAVSWPVTITAGPIWNTAGPFPILMRCESEIVSVTAISGAGPGQTMTVTRSVNGVVAGHASGKPLSLAYPSRLAL